MIYVIVVSLIWSLFGLALVVLSYIELNQLKSQENESYKLVMDQLMASLNSEIEIEVLPESQQIFTKKSTLFVGSEKAYSQSYLDIFTILRFISIYKLKKTRFGFSFGFEFVEFLIEILGIIFIGLLFTQLLNIIVSIGLILILLFLIRLGAEIRLNSQIGEELSLLEYSESDQKIFNRIKFYSSVKIILIPVGFIKKVILFLDPRPSKL